MDMVGHVPSLDPAQKPTPLRRKIAVPNLTIGGECNGIMLSEILDKAKKF